MKTKTSKIIVVALFLTIASGCASMQVKKTLKTFNYSVAVAVVDSYKGFYQFASSEEGTYQLCKSIIEKHKASGVYDEELAQKECKEKIKEIEDKFDKALSICANSLQLMETSLDIWDGIDKKDQIKIIMGVKDAVKNLIELFEEFGVPMPESLKMLSQSILG